MNRTTTRRDVVLGGLGTLTYACAAPRKATSSVELRADATRELSALESRVGGRVGVFALDTRSGKQLAHRADERFAMCSTFKWALSAAILARVERGELSLDDRVFYAQSDLLEYAPVTRAHADAGAMSVGALAEAAVVISDNTAANLLLARVGGPAGFTRFCKAQGDRVTRLDRNEPSLNSNHPSDPRDTSSPRAMVTLMQRILCGDALANSSRERLLGWLRACETGKERIRAGLPDTWVVGDKTGTGNGGAVNDVAIAVPPNGAPVLIAAYLSDSNSELKALQAAHADVGRLVAQEFRPR